MARDVSKVCAAQRAYYYWNWEHEQKRKRKKRRRIREWFNEYREQFCCADCKESVARCLEFHHPVPDEKEKSVSRMVSLGHAKQTIRKEIDSCVVLCGNCHRKRHREELGW